MKRMILEHAWLSLSILILLCCCSPLANEDDEDSTKLKMLKITISASARVTSASAPVNLFVRAENCGHNRVVWGYGSSTCQLNACVRIRDICYPVVGHRYCTADQAELGLNPSESRVENWSWKGQILKDHETVTLHSGKYKVHGSAGRWVSPTSVEIAVLQP